MSTPIERTPVQYRETIQQFLRNYYEQRKWDIEQAFLGVQLPLLPNDILYGSALADQLAEIARLAAGEMDVPTAIALGVGEGIQDLMERLFAAPGTGYSYTIPQSFWQTPLGAIVSAAHFRLRGDDLITITEAARMLDVSVQAISNRIDRGQLAAYRDPDEPNPQRARRVLRSQVEALASDQ